MPVSLLTYTCAATANNFITFELQIETRQFDRPMSNVMAALSHEDISRQSLADAHYSSAVQ